MGEIEFIFNKIKKVKSVMLKLLILKSSVLLYLFSSFMSATAGGVKDLEVFHRESQSFITFKEDKDVKGERYRVYQSDKPITEKNVKGLKPIAILEEGSSRLRFRDSKSKFPTFEKLGIKNAVIQDMDKGGKPLSNDTGLLVWTVKKAAATYYAVVLEKDGKSAGSPVLGINSLKKPVAEKTGVPGAIKIQHREPGMWIYMYWNDYTLWNPRVLDDCPIGIANVFQIMLPKKKELWTKSLAVNIEPHGYGALGHMRNSTSSMGKFNWIKILPKNFMNTWHYGHSNAMTKTDYLDRKFRVIKKGVVVNYFWHEMNFLVKWVMKKPANFTTINPDPNRIYMKGFSQGGTGANTVGIRHGELFASVNPDKGICNWTREKVGT
ncbi:MAG: hypothetical protein HRT89_14390, partial [Lentisphaeria bacterium]|nr:hypothetical protein [Lentisphaeria bacterium]